MNSQILRRRKLGYGSCIGIANEATEPITVIRNDQAVADGDIIFRWGCTSTVNKTDPQFIFNYTKAIHVVSDKIGFRKAAIEAGISCPETFFTKQDAIEAFTDGNKPDVDFIGRKKTHSQGKHAEHIVDLQDMMESVSDYWSVVIPKEKEYRIYCFMGRVIVVAEKIPTDPTALLWNNAQGGSKFVNVRWGDWPINVVREALKAHKISGLDYEGVDLMEHEGTPYLLESNSAPSLTSPYRKSCFSKAFSWAIKQIKETNKKPKRQEIPEHIGSWKDVIHESIKG